MSPEVDLFAIERGSVTAPAGCGKTQLICDTANRHTSARPILILTHTNAGAAALRGRLARCGTAPGRYRVKTLDGFSLQLVADFPQRSSLDPRVLELRDRRNDYPAIRAAALSIVKAGHISAILRGTYARLLVDEYQDCNTHQHELVVALATILPTVALGDPMQAVFGFAGNRLVGWQDVQTHFPAIGTLATPWRWVKAGNIPLGNWLLEARTTLMAGGAIDLRTAPECVHWVRLSESTAEQQRRQAALTPIAPPEDSLLILGDSLKPADRHRLASQTPGATTVEPVDLPDLVNFANRFRFDKVDALDDLAQFAAELMTQVRPTAFLERLRSIKAGRARNPPTAAEAAAIAFSRAPCGSTALALLRALETQPDARAYRREVLRCLQAAMGAVGDSASESVLLEAVIRSREHYRHRGRPVSRRAIGSTLLLKGLEADVAVVLHPERMNAPNLYVALTRGARRLVVCSATAQLSVAP